MKTNLPMRLKTHLLRGLSGAGLLVAATAMAQEAVLEEIVVTAQRTETSLQQTPIAVTAYDSGALEQRGVTNLADLGTFAPSLTITARPGAGGSRASFSLRGMSVNAENSSAAVGVYVDEVYFPSAQGNSLGLLDTARVEILRGPQGTLFGRNTIAGAVQYVSVKPKNEFEGYVTATVGNHDREHLEGVLNVPLLADTLAMRLSLSTDQMGGYVYDQLNGIKRGEVQTDLGRLQLRWTPTDSLTIDLKADGSRQDTNGRALEVTSINPFAQFAVSAVAIDSPSPADTVLGFPYPPGPGVIPPNSTWGQYVSAPGSYQMAGFNAPDFFTSDQSSYAANIAYDITDSIKFKSISAYFKTESESVTDTDGTPLPIFAATRGVNTDEVFSQEFQVNGKSFADRLSWTTGLFYYDSESTKVGQVSLLGPSVAGSPFFPFRLPVSDTRDDVVSKAVYAQATYKLTDKLSVTAGLRYSKEDIDSTVTKGSGIPGALPAPYTVSDSFSDASPHLGFDYQLTPDAMLYVKGSKGFRAGGITLNDTLAGGGIPFDPETAWTYEAGARLEFLNRSLRVNPTVYYTDWQAIQFNKLVFSGGNVAIASLNAGDAVLKGFELEMQWAATNRLVMTASGSYQDAKYTSIGISDVSLNDPLQQAPEYKFSIGGQYTQPLASGAKLVGSADYGWTDEQRSSVTDSDSRMLPAYGLLNGRLAYHGVDDHWSVALYGSNLLDKVYYTGASMFGQGFTILADSSDLGRPREYGVTLRFNF